MALDVCPTTFLASLLPMLGDYLEILGVSWSATAMKNPFRD